MSAAAKGDPIAQCRLGRDYDDGILLPKNYILAREWLTRSAAQHDGCGLTDLGNLYFNGDGVTRDYVTARGFYNAGALAGYAPAYYDLGTMYEYGDGVPVDERVAIGWLTKAAEAKYTLAYTELGDLYAFGHQTRIRKAGVGRHYYRMALAAPQTADTCGCEAEHRERAAQNLAFLYLIVYQSDDRLRYQMVMHLLRTTSSSPWSQYEIGNMYAQGTGVAKNAKTAATWFKMAADDGYAPAATAYATYLLGLGNGASHKAEALSYVREAVEGGDADGVDELAEMNWDGRDVPRDRQGAIELLTLASANGSLGAIIDLASRYFNGIGVPRDRYKAYILFNVAADTGARLAPAFRHDLEKQLTAEQLQTAQFEIKRLDQTVLTALDEQTDLPPVPASARSTL